MFNENGGYSLADIAAASGTNRGDGFFGGDSGWWIILLFLFGFGNGGWGGNGNQESTREAVSYGFDVNDIQRGIIGTQNGICDGFYAMNTGMLTGFGEVQNTLGKNFSDLNTAINVATGTVTSAIQNEQINNMQNTNTLLAQLNNMAAANEACCCATQRAIESGFAEANYNLASQSGMTRQTVMDSTRDIIQNNNEGIRSILDFLTQDKIATLTAENQGLKFAASQAAQNTYLIDQLRPSPIPSYIVANPYCCGGYAASNCGCVY